MGIGRALKKVVGGIGDAAKFAIPVATAAGIGVPFATPLAFAAGVAGEANDKDGFNIGQGLTAGAMSAGATYLAGRGSNGGGGLSSSPGGATAAGGGQGGAGNFLSRGMDWLTDPERGQARTALFSGAMGTGANIYGAHQMGAAEDEEREYRRRRDERIDPHRDRILEMLSRQYGGGR